MDDRPLTSDKKPVVIGMTLYEGVLEKGQVRIREGKVIGYLGEKGDCIQDVSDLPETPIPFIDNREDFPFHQNAYFFSTTKSQAIKILIEDVREDFSWEELRLQKEIKKQERAMKRAKEKLAKEKSNLRILKSQLKVNIKHLNEVMDDCKYLEPNEN